MNKKNALAEVFVTAFKALSQREKELVVEKLLMNLKLRQDIIDVITYLQRQPEKSFPYEQVQAELRSRGKFIRQFTRLAKIPIVQGN